MLKNRYGDEYGFEMVSENVYKTIGNLKHWRCGGKEGQQGIDMTDLGFIDPSGGPFIQLGSKVEGRPVKRISMICDTAFLEVE